MNVVPPPNDPNGTSTGPISPETFRFRVNRVNSLAVGCHPVSSLGDAILESVDENSGDNLPYVTSYPFDSYQLPSPASSGDTADLISPDRDCVLPANNNLISNFVPGRKFSRNSQLPGGGIPSEATMAGHGPPSRKFSLAGILGRRKSSNLPEIDDFAQNNSTVGLYGKSLYRYTHDALPKMENYRDIMSIAAAQRPTIDELHDEFSRKKSLAQFDDLPQSTQVKFGWIEGCLVRCLLNIWGVMLFLRLSWMVAHAGIIQSMIIIAISTVVTTITTLSMSAVSTNGEIKGGGIYYMISRSLGPEWGGAIGVVFSFANSGMAALNTVGFSESMISLLATNGIKIIDGGQNDNRIISCIAILVLQSIIIIGMEWEAKAQMGLLVILLVAMIDFVIGAFMGPQTDLEYAKGWVGLNATVFAENLGGGYRFSEGQNQDFFTIFSIFFPAVAGIQAGASISGDLKNPGEAIPKGTLLAIFITSASYAAFAILAGSGVLREASGIESELPGDNMTNTTLLFTNCTGRECKWGLYNDFQVMELMSIFGPLIYAGCFAATLSSALSCLVSGPKTFQALCKDHVYPYLTKFGIGYGKSDDPYWSYGLGFIIALIFILIADLNAIAPLISNFFMAAYALLNFCAFHASLVKPVSWRPTFKYYNTWVSLIGAILCVVVMFLMSWVTALVSFACVISLYCGVIYRKPDLNWGTSTQAQTYSDALSALQTLADQQDHVKNYRPQILCLTGYPSARPALVDFANLITKNQSLLVCGHIEREKQPTQVRKALIKSGYEWIHERQIKAFYVMVDNCTFDEGTQALLQATGIGKLAPNIVMMGYKTNWQTCPRDELRELFNTIHEAFDNRMAIAILRVKDGLDCSHLVASSTTNKGDLATNGGSQNSLTGYDNPMAYDHTDPTAFTNGSSAGGLVPSSPQSLKTNFAVDEEKKKQGNIFGKKRNKSADDLTSSGKYHGPDGSEIPKDIVANLSLFQTKQGKGVIDVWWLYDDGGLTLLLPYIINQRKNWAGCKLRVFALANKKDEMEQELQSMASLLTKFRIDYSDLKIIPDITKRAEDPKKKEKFESLIKDFKGDPDESEYPEMVVGDSEMFSMKEKTNRHLRLRELLEEHSSKSNLIVMTLPIPRKGTVSAPMYMAWLETLTAGLPPFLLVRGNQTSVLTFYS